jgi:hypothetical protein
MASPVDGRFGRRRGFFSVGVQAFFAIGLGLWHHRCMSVSAAVMASFRWVFGHLCHISWPVLYSLSDLGLFGWLASDASALCAWVWPLRLDAWGGGGWR